MAQALPANCCGVPSCSSLTIDWETTDLSGWFAVEDLAALYLVEADSGNKFASVGDETAFIGMYHWAADSEEADNGVTVINPTGNTAPGRWIKVL